MILGTPVLKLMERITEKNAGYYPFSMYANTIKHLKKKFPVRWNSENRETVAIIKERLDLTIKQRDFLDEKIEALEKELQKTCVHPFSKLTHGGYACSGSPIYDQSLDSEIHEIVECSVCGMRHGFGQEVTQEYRNDD